jgi:hypothetical protein
MLFLRTLLIGVALIGLLLGMRAAQELLALLCWMRYVALALLFASLLRWLKRKGC